MSNIELLPFLQFSVTTYNNADWNDGIVFLNNSAQVCVLASISAPGSDYTSGTQTLSVVGGTGTPTQVSAVVIGGAVVALAGLANAGLYSLMPATSNVPTSGGGGSGCLLNLEFQGTPIDLTGISFRSTIRATASNPAVALNTSTASGSLISGGTNGALSYIVPKATMKTITPGSYVADIVATDATGVFVLVASINITHLAGVTL